MNRFSEVLKLLVPLLPLKIMSIRFEGEQLIIKGENWGIGLSTSCWRVIKDGILLFGQGDSFERKIKELEGLSIIGVKPQSKFLNSDLAIMISNGYIIETFSTIALEPWNIGINGQFFYADPSSLDWTS